jgi:hypothetical protein
MKMKSRIAFLVIVFVAACILILAMLPSSVICREGIDKTLAAAPPAATATEEEASADKKLMDLDVRLTALEASVKESKESIADGEMEANAAIGNLQMTLPS